MTAKLQQAESAIVDIVAIFASLIMMIICPVLQLSMPEAIALVVFGERMVTAGKSQVARVLVSLGKFPQDPSSMAILRCKASTLATGVPN